MSTTPEKLMDLAEAHIRQGGYGGFSFRDLAAELGIKSASVHHHFPTKPQMAAAVARRYCERFLEAVAPRSDTERDDPISIYRTAFREGIERDGKMCLFGVLGAEMGALPPEVVTEIHAFFRLCIDDLTRRIGGPEAQTLAFEVMATLEGGVILARAYDSIEPFDQAAASLA